MFPKKNNQKFKIEIVQKKQNKKTTKSESLQKVSGSKKVATIDIIQNIFAPASLPKNRPTTSRTQSPRPIKDMNHKYRPSTATIPSKINHQGKNIDIDNVATDPQQITDIFAIKTYDPYSPKKSSVLFSNELMRKLDNQFISKSSMYSTHSPPKKALEENKTFKVTKNGKIRIYIDEINPITCQTISLKQAPVHKRNLLMPSRSLITSSKVRRQNRKMVKISKASTARVMAFHANSNSQDLIYMKKLKSYLDFLFKINFSNRVYVPLNIKDCNQFKRKKVYIGYGNNSQIIKLAIKKRFWLEITDNQTENVSFSWTPLKRKQVHSRQNKASIRSKTQFNPLKMKPINSQNIPINKKILSENDATLVQNFVMPDGYVFPQNNSYFPQTITNHLPENSCITQKKKLFKVIFHHYASYLKKDPFQIIPITYSIKNKDDPEFKRFLRDNSQNMDSKWIIKPGQDSNRGQGIEIATIQNIIQVIKKQSYKSYIFQKYISNPLLYNKRKFDIRHFLLVTSINGILKAYWYHEGYIRTCSEQFDPNNINNIFIHLTNDSIQKKSPNYGKYQPINKLSYTQFQRYMQTKLLEAKKQFSAILQQMKQIALQVIKASYTTLDYVRKQSNFQLFGLDFMIDDNFKPWLIQINENPCLQTPSYLLQRIISGLIEQTLRIGLDPLVPPGYHFPSRNMFGLNDHYLQTCKYQLIFDQLSEQKPIPIIYDLIQDSQEQFSP